ncbi:MAG: single-stranded DNA-binding protein [Cyanobacteria bacterium]|nr:single-stranded DNA-binding protein [Cyanobacteriota bacterium]
MNHCLLEVEVLEAPQVRYTQDNQTPVAEMAVRFDGLRPEDPPGQIKVVGWGNLAQDLQNRAQAGQRLVVEGRLRMNTVSRADGVKEKRAELTLARLHPLGDATARGPASAAGVAARAEAAPTLDPAPRNVPRPIPQTSQAPRPAPETAPRPAAVVAETPPVWNTSPLVADDLLDGDDDIPF